MGKKKVIKLYIDEESFPMLFNIKNENLGELCYNIFKFVYNKILKVNKKRNKIKEI